MSIPPFLARKMRFRPSPRLDETAELYRPLLGSWLIKLALMLRWYEPEPDRHAPPLFSGEFSIVTGIAPEEERSRSRRPTAAHLKKVLTARLEELQEEDLPPELPLFSNLQLFTEILELTEAEQALLLFAALFDLFPLFHEAVNDRDQRISDHLLWRILASLTGIAESEFRLATSSEGILVSAGLLTLSHTVTNITSKAELMEGLCGVLLVPHADADELMVRFLRRAAPATLTLDNFPHLASDTGVLAEYLGEAVQQETTGVNILLAGKAGVGKTEYAQALAAALGGELYEISYCAADGEPIRGTSRLRAYSFCQRLLRRSRNALLMFDEIEDVFPSDYGFLSFLFGSGDRGGGSQSAGKAWINRTMEQNPVPAIWISNRTDQIDQAYLRRFDYSVVFTTPPRQVRLSIAEHHLGCFAPGRDWLERVAGNEQLTPGQLERAAKVARIAAGSHRERALELADQTLQRSMALLDQKRTPSGSRLGTGYQLAWLNTDLDVSRLLAGLKRRPSGTFCFYGAAGTGKSELARHIADQIGRPVLVRRASDLLGMYVGESEKQIAAMFEEARRQEAVLVLDEADSFLSDRRGAQRSWEVTQVNELLTQMELFEGIFICTTNLMERLDQASLRRFSFKVRFDPLTPDQRCGLFGQELKRLGVSADDLQHWEAEVRRLEGVTPGDFAVAVRQFELWGVAATPAELFEQLRRECSMKQGTAARIGFAAATNEGQRAPDLLCRETSR